ncbi:MAG: hypothetical protein IJM30_06370 [Thermoguttaceae bacterium]|nr:hypothetical protein [Thermoguttaceae bacterium]
MKKFIALMLVAACATFCSFGCKKADTAPTNPPAQNQNTEDAVEKAADATEEAAEAATDAAEAATDATEAAADAVEAAADAAE